MKQKERNEDAVSPVIGVMLMLVVTVVIAAVVTAFATGMAGDSTSTTPMALLEADNQQMTMIDIMNDEYITIGQAPALNSFDIVHKGGDEMALENIQVLIEPSGSDSSYGILLVRTANDLEVLGKTGNDITVSTGDRFRITLNTNRAGEQIKEGNLVKWTVSDIRTTGVIGKGEFVVGA